MGLIYSTDLFKKLYATQTTPTGYAQVDIDKPNSEPTENVVEISRRKQAEKIAMQERKIVQEMETAIAKFAKYDTMETKRAMFSWVVEKCLDKVPLNGSNWYIFLEYSSCLKQFQFLKIDASLFIDDYGFKPYPTTPVYHINAYIQNLFNMFPMPRGLTMKLSKTESRYFVYINCKEVSVGEGTSILTPNERSD